jgi:hypothetical protein
MENQNFNLELSKLQNTKIGENDQKLGEMRIQAKFIKSNTIEAQELPQIDAQGSMIPNARNPSSRMKDRLIKM